MRQSHNKTIADYLMCNSVRLRDCYTTIFTDCLGFSAFAMAQRLVVRDRCLLCKYMHGGTGRRHEWLVLWRSGALSFFRQSKSCGHNKMECFCFGGGVCRPGVGQLGLVVLSFVFSHSFPMPYHTIPRSKNFYLESQGHWSATTGDHFDVHSFACCPQLGVRRHDVRFTRRSAFWPGNCVPCFSTAVSFYFSANPLSTEYGCTL